MKKFKIVFRARRCGSIGIIRTVTSEREGVNVDAAVLALGDEYEHVRVLSYTESEK